MKKNKRQLISAIAAATGLALCLCLTGCGEHQTIRNNEALGEILTRGKAPSTTEGEAPSHVEDLPDISSPADGVVFYKLKPGTANVIPEGKYTIGSAEDQCSVTVRDGSGNTIAAGVISAENDTSITADDKAMIVDIPSGSNITVTAGCIAQKH